MVVARLEAGKTLPNFCLEETVRHGEKYRPFNFLAVIADGKPADARETYNALNNVFQEMHITKGGVTYAQTAQQVIDSALCGNNLTQANAVLLENQFHNDDCVTLAFWLRRSGFKGSIVLVSALPPPAKVLAERYKTISRTENFPFDGFCYKKPILNGGRPVITYSTKLNHENDWHVVDESGDLSRALSMLFFPSHLQSTLPSHSWRDSGAYRGRVPLQ